MSCGQKPWLKFFDPRVAHDISIPYKSLFDLLKRAAEEYGDTHAFTFNGSSWSYNQARTIAEWFAASLYRNGFKKGDRLSNMIP
jgi:long-chain acyl-CoA synthetase